MLFSKPIKVSENKIVIRIYFVTFVHGNSFCTLMRMCSLWLLLVFSRQRPVSFCYNKHFCVFIKHVTLGAFMQPFVVHVNRFFCVHLVIGRPMEYSSYIIYSLICLYLAMKYWNSKVIVDKLIVFSSIHLGNARE